MKLEDQVCSLELARKLMELRAKQKSLFYWYYAMHDGVNSSWSIMYSTYALQADRYSAFTVAELGELLPDFIQPNKDEDQFNCIMMSKLICKNKTIYSVYSVVDDLSFECINEANARAMMLIYLLENKIICI